MEHDLSTEPPQDEPAPSFNPFELVLFGVARFYPWILFMALVGLGVGLLNSLRLPNQYASQGKFLVRLGEREKQTPEGAVGFQTDARGMPTNLDIVQILKSREVFERLAEGLGPERLLEPFDPTAHDNDRVPIWTRWLHQKQKDWFFSTAPEVDPESPQALDRATTKAMAASGLRADPVSRFLTVTFRATSPRLAQDGAQLLMKLCQEHHREVFSRMVQDSFISEQLAQAREQQNSLEQRWADHTRECGFLDINKEKASILGALSKLDEQEKDAEHQIQLFTTEIAQLEQQMAELPAKIEIEVPAKEEPNPAIDRFRAEIEDGYQQIARLGEVFQTDSEPYKRKRKSIEAQIARVQAQLDQAPATIVVQEAGTKEVENPPYKALQDRRTDIKTRQRDMEIELTVRRTGSQLQRERLEARMEEARACEPLHESMQEERNLAGALVRQLTSVQSDQQRLALLDLNDEMSNLVVIQEPRYEARKVGPQRSKFVIQGLGAGAAAGLAFCILRQLLDRKLRYPPSVERVLGLKVLGVIPETRAWRRAGRKVKRRVAV